MKTYAVQLPDILVNRAVQVDESGERYISVRNLPVWYKIPIVDDPDPIPITDEAADAVPKRRGRPKKKVEDE